MGLEVWLELAGYCNQSEGELLYRWVPLFYTMECPTGVVHGLLHLVFFSNQSHINSSCGYDQEEEQFFPWFGRT